MSGEGAVQHDTRLLVGGAVFVATLLFWVTFTTAPSRGAELQAGPSFALALGVVNLLLFALGWVVTYRYALRAQRRNLADQVRVELYRDLVQRYEVAFGSITEAHAFFMTALPATLTRLAHRWSEETADGTLDEWDGRVKAVSNGLSRLTAVATQHKSVFGDVATISTDIGAASLEWEQDVDEIYRIAVPALTHGLDARPDALNELLAGASSLCPTTMQLGAYVGDFRTEAERILLAPLFDATIERRRPRDPSNRVLRPGDQDASRRHEEQIERWARGSDG